MQKLWGGRFAEGPDVLIEKLNDSLSFDARLWPQDIQGSIAHGRMLGKVGVLTPEEALQIIDGLDSIRTDLNSGAVALPEDAEDVHTAVEGLLKDRIGAVAGKLHTARSRNDQVCTDFRLWLREACDDLSSLLKELQQCLLTLAERELETVMPGYTHLQHAQPILLSHHLLAYFWMLDRDRERLSDARRRINRLPLGAAALAGTVYPIDRQMVADELGFEAVLENSLDAVSDRDFVVEFLAAASCIIMHLSRFSEEIILWNSQEFQFISLSDKVTTGSSIMPQKKNPDAAELTRGKSGRIYGALLTLLVLLKGLPLAYNKDMQEDKEPAFDAFDTLSLVIPAMKQTLETAQFRRDRMESATRGDFSTATDLADYLVRSGIPFREAHHIVGEVVRYCLDHKLTLETISPQILPEISPALKDSVQIQELLTVRSSVAARISRGGTSEVAVREQLVKARELFLAK